MRPRRWSENIPIIRPSSQHTRFFQRLDSAITLSLTTCSPKSHRFFSTACMQYSAFMAMEDKPRLQNTIPRSEMLRLL